MKKLAAHGIKVPAWKDKILDYEIETGYIRIREVTPRSLEKIRFSITRLKHGKKLSEVHRRKILEKIRFSITRLKLGKYIATIFGMWPWKDKILDYEIETP